MPDVSEFLFVLLPILFFIVFLVLPSMSLYIEALTAGARVSLFHLVLMRFRRVSAGEIVRCYIMTQKVGLDISLDDLEVHHLYGGNVHSVCRAMIAADRGGIELTWKRCVEMDLGGQDVWERVKNLLVKGEELEDMQLTDSICRLARWHLGLRKHSWMARLSRSRIV
jgi:uncharacterized protein YqfA (UPF0365 family)